MTPVANAAAAAAAAAAIIGDACRLNEDPK